MLLDSGDSSNIELTFQVFLFCFSFADNEFSFERSQLRRRRLDVLGRFQSLDRRKETKGRAHEQQILQGRPKVNKTKKV